MARTFHILILTFLQEKINYRHRLTQIDTDEKINVVKNSLSPIKEKDQCKSV